MMGASRPAHPKPMHFDATSILQQLSDVAAERRRRQALPEAALRVQAVKRYQQQRFAHTYADLLGSPRYRGAARFFLDELYGPQDFTERDAQLARVVPALVRLFPGRIVDVVGTLVSLHALSERLDGAMGQQLTSTAPMGRPRKASKASRIVSPERKFGARSCKDHETQTGLLCAQAAWAAARAS